MIKYFFISYSTFLRFIIKFFWKNIWLSTDLISNTSFTVVFLI